MSTVHVVDVLVIGGAFSGASAALLLRRRRPDVRVAIVERSGTFDRKVGEATVEMWIDPAQISGTPGSLATWRPVTACPLVKT